MIVLLPPMRLTLLIGSSTSLRESLAMTETKVSAKSFATAYVKILSSPGMNFISDVIMTKSLS